MSLIFIVIPTQAKVTFIRPFEYSNGLIFAYADDSGSIFIPATNGQFPAGRFDNISLLIIPDRKGEVVFSVAYGKLNTTTGDFLPDTTKELSIDVTGRSEAYNLKLSITETISYVMISFPGLELTFSYESTDDAILLQNSKSSLTQIITQNVILGAIISLFSTLSGGIVSRRAGKLVIPIQLYYFLAGVFIALVFLAVAVGANLALTILFIIIALVSFFVSAKKFEADLKEIDIDVFVFEGNRLKYIEPYEILTDQDKTVIHETFVDMFFRILGIKTKMNIPITAQNWANNGSLYFAEDLVLEPPRFIINLQNIALYILLGLGIASWWVVQEMFSIIFLSAVVLLWFVISRFFEFTVIKRGVCDVQYSEAVTSKNLARTLLDLGYVHKISGLYVKLQDQNHKLKIEMEEKTYSRAKTMSKQILDMFEEVMTNDRSGKIQDRGNSSRRSSDQDAATKQTGSKNGKARRAAKVPRAIQSSGGDVAN